MRTTLLLAAALVACTGTEKPATDTAAAPGMAAAPTSLAPAQLTGKWNGEAMGEASDSIINRYVTESADGVHGTLTMAESKTVVPFTMTYAGDSVVIASDAPFPVPAMPSLKVSFRSVGRMKDGKLVGTTTNMIGTSPGSVVSRSRWVATKAP